MVTHTVEAKARKPRETNKYFVLWYIQLKWTPGAKNRQFFVPRLKFLLCFRRWSTGALSCRIESGSHYCEAVFLEVLLSFVPNLSLFCGCAHDCMRGQGPRSCNVIITTRTSNFSRVSTRMSVGACTNHYYYSITTEVVALQYLLHTARELLYVL